MTIEEIPSLLAWFYSGDPLKELFSIKLSTKLIAKNKEVEDAMNFLVRKGKLSVVKNMASRVKDQLEKIPFVDSKFIDLPEDWEKDHKIPLPKHDKSPDNIHRIIEERRCCKMHGRLGDKYCNVCGRTIEESWIINL